MSQTQEMLSIKPHRGAFYLPSLLLYGVLFAFCGLFVAFLTQAFLGLGAGGTLIVYLAAVSFSMGVVYWLLSIVHKKTFYMLSSEKIIYKTGTLFSDKELELPIKNITHLRLQLPFVSYTLFKTGNVSIESAGSSSAEGRFLAISNSKELYGQLQDLMRENGFSLQKQDLKEEMKPSLLAVVLDTVKFLIASAFVVFFVGLDFLIDDNTGEIDESLLSGIFVVGATVFACIIIFALFRYVDLRKRVYKVYEDVITYREGFLTKNQSIIPFENLTDSLATQTIVDRIFGLFDVALSCQGAKKEIKFKNIVGGDKLSQSIKSLVKSFKDVQKNTVMPAQAQRNPERVHALENFDTTFVSTFKMDKTRALIFPILGLLIMGILSIFSTSFIVFAIVMAVVLFSAFITVLGTTYTVESQDMRYYFKFLRTRENSFLNERITSVVFRESWLDKIFKTCQIEFGSIGSASKIKFKHLKKQATLYDSILPKLGIVPENMDYELRPNFGFFALLKSNLVLPLLLALFVIGFVLSVLISNSLGATIAVGCVLTIGALVVYAYKDFYYKRANVQFFKNYLRIKKGILIQTRAYAAYKNVKDIETVKYPLTKTGDLNFNVAGEDVTNQENDGKKVAKYLILGQQAAKTRKFSHGLALRFIQNIPLQNDLLDYILRAPISAAKISALSEDLLENPLAAEISEKPDVSNTLAWLMLLGLLPLFSAAMSGSVQVLAIIVIALVAVCFVAAWIVKAISFEIQSFRVVKRSGIFYRKQISVLYSKMDHINKSQGLLNKVFRNGNLAIHTIGSSKLEVGVRNLSDYESFYQKIKAEI